MRLRLASGAVYVVVAGFGLASIAAPLVVALRAIVRPWSYEPDLRLPWLWVALAVPLVLLVADVVRRLAAPRPVGLARYGALLALALGAVAARHLFGPPARVPVEDGLSVALAQVAVAADAAFDAGHAYPTDPAVLARSLPAPVRDLGFRARLGRSVETRLVVRKNALAPVLAPGPGIAPGTLVLAVDPARRRYWLSAFALGREGRPVLLLDETGRAILLAGADGKPRSALDDAFPEYPHKIPLGGSSTAGAP